MKVVIMAGGHGTRFWPLSRKNRPKQFLRLGGERSLLRQAVDRLLPIMAVEDVFVVTGESYVEQILNELPELKREQVIVEPQSLSTAPCIGLSAVYLKKRGWGEEAMAVLPSDHFISDTEEFCRVLKAAEILSRKQYLVTFGIEPSHPATGYGYIQRGRKLEEIDGTAAYEVKRFTEKPKPATASRFFQQGDYLWNSGMFVWSVNEILQEMRQHLPDLYEVLSEIEKVWEDRGRVRRLFSRAEKISIDYGVMEKTRRVAVLPCKLGWCDVGNLQILSRLLKKDFQGIASNTRYVSVDSRNCTLSASKDKLIALIGVEDLVIIETADAILVCDSRRTEDVKKAVQEIEDQGWVENL
ncbi:MAG: mannose-1-phosphate guanylyltransferase [Acidobacteria bacterium]|nr:mannose-1-phosphate guanylyltransferase [Acidobacteriota bacterium]